MGRDWKRLADAVRAARTALGMTQVELADAAGVAEATVQNLEGGKDRNRLPTSLPRVERALRWGPGSGAAILNGGEPASLPPTLDTETGAAESAPAAAEGAPPGGLPLRIVQELADGQLLDTTVMDLTPLGSEARMIVVVKGKPDASPEQIRRDLLAWQKAQRKLQNLGGDDEDDPPVANEA
ncbi:helix-turn-helix transcriptional regulator [Streptomyces asiaticus]|uniref:helix-turn-helix transcriptional regulator n=1 Tax=Streptomyces asiaticus TaxID=114695 RepID=UPI001BAD95C7|nr:helix-turn-helix domain-containing protein [Streptomyces asiaticus]